MHAGAVRDGMAPLSSARLSVFAHATEDEPKVLAALKTLLPKGVEPKHTRLRGHYGNPIVVLEAVLKNRRLVSEVWQNILTRLSPEELDRLRIIAPQRVDDSCYLYFRFDKQLAHRGELTLSEGDDVVHVKFKVAAYPPKRARAVELVREALGEKAETKIRGV